MIYAERFGNAAYIVKARTHLMRDLGAQAAPQNAFLLNLGLETLALRMERHCSNAQTVAEFLENHPKVEWINYPGLEVILIMSLHRNICQTVRAVLFHSV